MIEKRSWVRFYHVDTAERNALKGKHLGAFEYLDTTA